MARGELQRRVAATNFSHSHKYFTKHLVTHEKTVVTHEKPHDGVDTAGDPDDGEPGLCQSVPVPQQ